MRKVIITEEQFNKNKKHLIREYLEALKGENADEALKVINTLYKRIAARIELGETHIEESETAFGARIDVVVDKNFKSRYHGQYFHSQRRITGEFNLEGGADYNIFKATILHEMTHLFDHKRDDSIQRSLNSEICEGAYRNILALLRGSNDEYEKALYNVVYRLWSRTERNAYTTDALGDEYWLNSYIQEGMNAIEKIRTYKNWNDKKYELVWKHIATLVGEFYYKRKLETIVNKFCKKSLHLLNLFKRKAMQRAKQHSKQEPNKYDVSSMEIMGTLSMTKSKIRQVVDYFAGEGETLEKIIQMLKDAKLITPYNQEELVQFATEEYNKGQRTRLSILTLFFEGDTPEEFVKFAQERGIKLDDETIIDAYNRMAQ